MPAIWSIYHVKSCSHTKPKPKDKFVAVVCKDLKLMGFFINSKVHDYIQKRPSLLASQVGIKASDYSFLDHDSYVNCIRLYPFDDTELVDSRGAINTQTKVEIQKAVTNSKTLEKRYKKLILGK